MAQRDENDLQLQATWLNLAIIIPWGRRQKTYAEEYILEDCIYIQSSNQARLINNVRRQESGYSLGSS